MPARDRDLAALISIGDVMAPDPGDAARRVPVWPDALFRQFIGIAESEASRVAGTSSRISLPPEVKSIGVWKIAGIRIDAGAPGLSPDIIREFGQAPQVRIILQPVTRNADGTLKIHDITGHLVFGVAQEARDAPAREGCFARARADRVALRALALELATLRTKLAEGVLGGARVTTADVPLGVHPGLRDAATAARTREEMKAFVERHVSAAKLDAMAIMGLPAREDAPWIFLSMVAVPPGAVPQLPNGGFAPVRGPALDGGQFAQMLNAEGTNPRVVPAPHANNMSPVTCEHAATRVPLPIEGRKGASTADLFAASGMRAEEVKSALDLIADPARSHFFNTDCVSCHTGTRIRMDRLTVRTIAGIETAALPNGPWNVRNFGWSPPIEGAPKATVSERTATETAEVVRFMNAELLAR